MSDCRDQWYVITGPPCCGKTTTVELLAQRGFRVRPEIARAYVDEEILKGRKIQEIRSDMRGFQCEVLRRALASEEALPRDQLIFFDRGIPDSLAYFLLHGVPPEPYINHIRSSKYRRVFYLDLLDEYQTDYARIESSCEQRSTCSAPLESLQRLGILHRACARANQAGEDRLHPSAVRLFLPVTPDHIPRLRSSWRIPGA